MKQKEFIGIIVLFSLLRVVLASVMGLMPQDAYYCYYGDHPALSYFDHPPMIGYLLHLAVFIFGKSALALHATDFMVTSGTLFFLYLFLRRILHDDDLKRAFILIVTAPFITLLCINSTPDVPLLFFWSLSLLLIHKAIVDGKWYFWLFGGITSGLAFDSKYTAVFLAFGLFAYLLYSKEHRKSLINGQFILFAIAFALTCLPVAIWNYQNDFISLKYQSTERASTMSTGFKFEPRLFLGYFGTQLALALPLFFLLIFRASFDTLKKFVLRKEIPGHQLFSASFTLPLFVSFTAIAFIYWVKINWLMPVYLTATVLVVPYFKNDKVIRWQTVFSIILHLVAFVELAWMPFPVNSDDTWWGWDKLAKEVQTVKAKHPGYFVFSDDSYKTSAALNFYLPEHVYGGNLIERHAFQFALDDRDVLPLAGRNAIYVSSEMNKRKRRDEGKVQNRLQRYFTTVTPLDSIILRNGKGIIQRKFEVLECKGYRPPTGNKLYP
ncbi:MAG: hypothetical protein H6Q17_2443 [Bacteroidetes bacterium]|nr:hypothetical protein [Bacteroidota bacterium]